MFAGLQTYLGRLCVGMDGYPTSDLVFVCNLSTNKIASCSQM